MMPEEPRPKLTVEEEMFVLEMKEKVYSPRGFIARWMHARLKERYDVRTGAKNRK